MNLLYPAEIKKNPDGYFVSFPDLDEAVTEGETLEEALFNASEVLTLTLEGRVDEGMSIPEPSSKKGKNYYQIAPLARVQSAILLKKARGNKSLADVARALETSWPAVSRLEDLHHTPTLKQIERMTAALGKQLIIEIR